MEEVNLTRDDDDYDDVYPSNGFEPLYTHTHMTTSACAISSIYSIKIDVELLSLNENRKAIISYKQNPLS